MKTCRRGHQHEAANCPECRKLRYLARKSEENASNKEWIRNNRERYKAKQKAYCEQYPERRAKFYKDWAERNPIHSIWRNMKRRCYNLKSDSYRRYGGRGITICDRWLGENGYANFESDMGPRPSPRHTIERMNNDGNYEPGNCKWATRSEQQHNRRGNRLITIDGRTQCLGVWAREFGLCVKTLQKRLDSGWPESRLGDPPNPRFRTSGRTGKGNKHPTNLAHAQSHDI